MTRARCLIAALFGTTLLLGQSVRAQDPKPIVRTILDTGTEWVAGVAEPASGRFLVYAEEQAIKIYNRQTQKTVSVAAKVVNAFGGSLSISRSGRRLIFPSESDDKKTTYIWTMDLDTLTGAPVGEPHRVSIMPAVMASISGDGRWIALAAIDNNARNWAAGTRLMIMPSDGGDERMLDSAGRILTPRWSPDGSTIFYVRGRGKGPALARVHVAGGAPDSLAPAGNVIGVSPDGKYVAFESAARSTQAQVQIADVNGHGVGSFLYNTADDRPHGWNRLGDGFLSARRLEPATLKTVSLADGKVSANPIIERFPFGARFSPDGSRLGMTTQMDGRDQFVVVDVQTKQRHAVSTTYQPERYRWQWSPDGSRIAFLSMDPQSQHHQLNVVEIATGKTGRLADLGVARGANSVLYRWRSDGKSLDYIPGTSTAHDGAAAELHRVTLTGAETVVRSLPVARQGDATDGGYRLINDALLVVGYDAKEGTLQAVPIPGGEPRMLGAHPAYWNNSRAESLISPDGKWIAAGSVGLKDGVKKPQWAIFSTDGKTFRLLGSAMGCDAWPVQWLPDSRSLVGVGADSCQDWSEETFLIAIDGSPARHITLPPNQGYTLTPDGRSLLVAVDDKKIASIISVDVPKLVGTTVRSRKSKSALP